MTILTMQTVARLLIACSLVALGSSATAQTDRVRTTSGSLAGKVTKITKMGVVLERGSQTKNIPVNEIRSIRFGEEPSELTQARVNAANGGYEKAIALLRKMDFSGIKNDTVKQDAVFVGAYCNAKRALLGEFPVKDAGKQLGGFLRSYPNSYHYLEANELLGDLLVTLKRYQGAEERYELLAKTPWPSYKTRAAVLVGRALQAQDKHAEAIARFESAEQLADDTPEGKQQLLSAQLGRAVSLTATGKVDQGVQLVRAVIAEAAPEEQQLHASAYNALGGCYLKAGRERDALYAYLHVDLLFNNQPEAHAEALYHLSTLWESIGKTGEAREARRLLKSRYASTGWAKR